MKIHEVYRDIEEGSYVKRSDAELNAMILVCGSAFSGGAMDNNRANHAAAILRAELERRERRQYEGAAETRHNELIGRTKPHWTMTPAFWVAVAAMVFAGIAALPVVVSWFAPAVQSERKAVSGPVPQSNSVREIRREPVTTNALSANDLTATNTNRTPTSLPATNKNKTSELR